MESLRLFKTYISSNIKSLFTTREKKNIYLIFLRKKN